MKRSFLTGLLAVFFHSLPAQDVKNEFSKRDVLDDLDDLYQSAQATHYNLFAYKSRKAYDKHFAALKSSVKKDSLTYLETVSLFQQLVTYANTGHFEVDYPVKTYIEYAYAGGTVFPLELAFENDKVYVRKNHSENTDIIPGDEILSVDEVPIPTLAQSMYPFVSAEREYFKKAKVEFWSFPRLLFQLQGKKEKWTVKYRKPGGSMLTLQLTGITVMEYEEKRKGEIVNPQQQFAFYGTTAYLNPGAFGGATDVDEENFKKYIDSCFAVLQAKKTPCLIIDLRNNPGGHNAYSDHLISYIAHKPFKWYSQFSIRTSAILKEKTREQDTTDDYAQKILAHADGERFAYEWPAQAPAAENKQFKGKVYVLVNRHTYSMAAVSAALIQDEHFGTVAGEETGDVPTLYASQFSYSLPKTQIVIKVPKGFIVRPSGNKKLKGVQPDLVITDHLLDEKDEILEAVLKQIEKN